MANDKHEAVPVEIDQEVYDMLAARAAALDMTLIEYLRHLIDQIGTL
jgi:hypothetical protein